MQFHDRLFIDGRWIRSTGSQTIDVRDAATGEITCRIPAGNAADIDTAVKAARRAFGAWSQTPLETRAQALEQIAAGLKRRSDDLARVIAREVGMPLKLAGRIQVGL